MMRLLHRTQSSILAFVSFSDKAGCHWKESSSVKRAFSAALSRRFHHVRRSCIDGPLRSMEERACSILQQSPKFAAVVCCSKASTAPNLPLVTGPVDSSTVFLKIDAGTVEGSNSLQPCRACASFSTWSLLSGPQDGNGMRHTGSLGFPFPERGPLVPSLLRHTEVGAVTGEGREDCISGINREQAKLIRTLAMIMNRPSSSLDRSLACLARDLPH